MAVLLDPATTVAPAIEREAVGRALEEARIPATFFGAQDGMLVFAVDDSAIDLDDEKQTETVSNNIYYAVLTAARANPDGPLLRVLNDNNRVGLARISDRLIT